MLKLQQEMSKMHNIHKVYFKQEPLIIKNTLKDKSLIQQEADVQSNENVEKLIVSFVPTIQKQEKLGVGYWLMVLIISVPVVYFFLLLLDFLENNTTVIAWFIILSVIYKILKSLFS